MIASVQTADDEVRAVATMASLLLGLLVFFTNVRREALKKHQTKGIPAFSHDSLVKALPDVGLAVFTGLAISVMGPLLFESFAFSDAWRRSGALISMFGLIWLGFVAVLAVQLSILWRRFRPAIKIRRTEHRARRATQAAERA